MTRRIVLLAVLTITATQLKAQQSFTIDMGTASNYIAHGRTLSGNLPCFQPSATYGLNTGTDILAWFSLPYDRNTSFNDEWNLIVNQSTDIFTNKGNWKMNLHGYLDYWMNPNTQNPVVEPDFYNGMKYNAGIHKPISISAASSLSMTVGYDYYFYQTFGAGRDILRDAGIHEFLIKFNKSFKNLNLGTKSVISNNRGAINPNIIPGWGFFLQQLSANFKIKKVSLSSSINYQYTIEKTLHEDNLLWFTLNISRGFKI